MVGQAIWYPKAPLVPLGVGRLDGDLPRLFFDLVALEHLELLLVLRRRLSFLPELVSDLPVIGDAEAALVLRKVAFLPTDSSSIAPFTLFFFLEPLSAFVFFFSTSAADTAA